MAWMAPLWLAACGWFTSYSNIGLAVGGKKQNRNELELCFHSKASDYSKIQKRLTKELQVNSLEVLSSVGIMV